MKLVSKIRKRIKQENKKKQDNFSDLVNYQIFWFYLIYICDSNVRVEKLIYSVSIGKILKLRRANKKVIFLCWCLR